MAQNSTELTPDQENYLEWLILPMPLRIPKTKTDYSEQSQIPRRTLYNWESSLSFNNERLRRIKINQKNYTPDIIEALRDKAISGDVQSMKIWLEWVEGTENKLQIQHSGNITVDAVKAWLNAKE